MSFLKSEKKEAEDRHEDGDHKESRRHRMSGSNRSELLDRDEEHEKREPENREDSLIEGREGRRDLSQSAPLNGRS
jgi:hypothetical protein